MLVELVLTGPDDNVDFEVRSCPKKLLSGVLGFDTGLSQQGRRNGGHDGGTTSLAL